MCLCVCPRPVSKQERRVRRQAASAPTPIQRACREALRQVPGRRRTSQRRRPTPVSLAASQSPEAKYKPLCRFKRHGRSPTAMQVMHSRTPPRNWISLNPSRNPTARQSRTLRLLVRLRLQLKALLCRRHRRSNLQLRVKAPLHLPYLRVCSPQPCSQHLHHPCHRLVSLCLRIRCFSSHRCSTNCRSSLFALQN